ncbi:protein-glutamine glutaminase family protein [Legionella shakespearei]|uniref:Protein glutaminase domain-containing protein n=1 Tax=Legionella shakespearei DSM 23087 TaxID=1122169 RepID=A0A0W0YVG4_9GAMM|nr:protein-glutamine glutaminase family protein [Legionella shakespearei]KTD60855.1 hypothetical protein Lsha_1572 [Legionella shakespearei DSM 23087]
MKLFISLMLMCPLIAFSQSPEFTISPKRLTNETFKQAITRVKQQAPQGVIKSLRPRETPVGNKVLFKDMDFSSVPMVASYEELMHLFKVIRDSRFLHTMEKPDFARRISWLYPDDGCFARAALSGIKLESEQLQRPAKIFAFGDLMVQTKYSQEGYVTWWYHVSTAVNYMGTIYILDPALNPDSPMLVDEWYGRMGNVAELTGAVCNTYTYDPFDGCFTADATSEAKAERNQERYLDWEWERVTDLGFDPVAFLGENPPWIIDTPNSAIR